MSMRPRGWLLDCLCAWRGRWDLESFQRFLGGLVECNNRIVKIDVLLQSQPEFRRRPKHFAETNGCIRRHASLAIQDEIQSLKRHPQGSCQFRLSDSQVGKKLVPQNFTR